MRKIIFSFICCLWLVSCDSCVNIPKDSKLESVDVVLIGAGIMSATLGAMLTQLDADLSIEAFEKLDKVGEESSFAWNNAGTGHAAFCELAYTPQNKDGSIDIKKAIEINKAFEMSKQFWAYMAKTYKDFLPESFIHKVAHVSFVWGAANTEFLKKRFDALLVNPLFEDMKYSENPEQIKKWIPLVMEGRSEEKKVAATIVEAGTDVDFGALSVNLFAQMEKTKNFNLNMAHEVLDINPSEDAKWIVTVKDVKNNSVKHLKTKFIFIGAGGGSLPLLQKSGIAQAKGYGGFPVGGQWLITDKEEIVEKHTAKVYGQAPLNAPPMSVPHLDARLIDGKKFLLFGPFAIFSTKFLKNGSWLDIFSSVNFGNVMPMLEAGYKNLDLTRYLISQLMLSEDERVKSLQEYMPTAKSADWRLLQAGQRVQIIKNTKDGGFIQFGTELVGDENGSIIALLGASPGASTAVQIMLQVLEKSFKKELASPKWQAKIKEMVPFYAEDPLKNPKFLREVKAQSDELLKLN